jgi:predicted nucleotidyltransferase component of viral defense system
MTNLAASIHARLLNRARMEGEDFNLVLTRYGIERLLYRLYKAGHGDRFILKGAQLLMIYTEECYRPTRDLDLLGFGDDDPEVLTDIFRQLCTLDVVPDGLAFDPSTVVAEPIRNEADYGGVRVRLNATLGRARIRIQVDIGFGDVVTPRPEQVQYPVMLGAPAPVLRAYPLPTIVAEKFESLVSLGLATSRMKDIYDLWRILSTFELEIDILGTAIRRTFDHRRTTVETSPVVFSKEFGTDNDKQRQWEAFIRRSRLQAPPLTDACAAIERALHPVLTAISTDFMPES